MKRKRLAALSVACLWALRLFAQGEVPSDPASVADSLGKTVAAESAGGTALPAVGNATAANLKSTSVPSNTEETQLQSDDPPTAKGRRGEGEALADYQPGKQIGLMIKNIFFILLVLGLLWALLRFIKKRNQNGMVSDDFMQVVSSKQLSGSRFLHVVKMGEHFYWIGSADGNVSLLKEIDDPVLTDELNLHQAAAAPSVTGTFKEFYHKWLKIRTKPQTPEEKVDETIQNIKKQSEDIKKL